MWVWVARLFSCWMAIMPRPVHLSPPHPAAVHPLGCGQCPSASLRLYALASVSGCRGCARLGAVFGRWSAPSSLRPLCCAVGLALSWLVRSRPGVCVRRFAPEVASPGRRLEWVLRRVLPELSRFNRRALEVTWSKAPVEVGAVQAARWRDALLRYAPGSLSQVERWRLGSWVANWPAEAVRAAHIRARSRKWNFVIGSMGAAFEPRRPGVVPAVVVRTSDGGSVVGRVPGESVPALDTPGVHQDGRCRLVDGAGEAPLSDPARRCPAGAG